MNQVGIFLCSSVGRKAIMAVTGVLLFFFVIAHLLGNLAMFSGPEAMNSYAEFLKSMSVPLWGARLGLLGVFGAHIIAAISLSRENKAARIEPYVFQNTVQASLPSRTMLITGIAVLIFVIFHLLHFTFMVIEPGGHSLDSEGRHDVFAMVVRGFEYGPFAFGYILSLFLLSFHLSHGISSFFQTLGLHSAQCFKMARLAGKALAAAIFLGYSSIPISVQLGIISISN